MISKSASRRKNNFLFAIFIITYSLACLTISTNRFGGYFSYSTTPALFVKYALVLVFVFFATVINKNNIEKITKYAFIFMNIILVLFIADNHFFNFSGTEVYYRMLWLSDIYITQFSFYIGLFAVIKKESFNKYSRKFWLAVTPTYIYSFAYIFIREPNTYLYTNFKLGQGLLSEFDYLKSHFIGNVWPVFNLVGNIVFFTPVAHLLHALFPKMKKIFIILIGILIPFLIEGYQYVLKCGSVDIDDIFLNESGFIIGFVLMIIEQKIKTVKSIND
ncbi:MAG: VanZ family protein [Clostridiales bacterium]|nr:VanZ family protein [Clostridiales bacterium]